MQRHTLSRRKRTAGRSKFCLQLKRKRPTMTRKRFPLRRRRPSREGRWWAGRQPHFCEGLLAKRPSRTRRGLRVARPFLATACCNGCLVKFKTGRNFMSTHCGHYGRAARHIARFNILSYYAYSRVDYLVRARMCRTKVKGFSTSSYVPYERKRFELVVC